MKKTEKRSEPKLESHAIADYGSGARAYQALLARGRGGREKETSNEKGRKGDLKKRPEIRGFPPTPLFIMAAEQPDDG